MEQRPEDCPYLSRFEPGPVCSGCEDVPYPVLGLGEECYDAYKVPDEDNKDQHANRPTVGYKSFLQVHVPPSPVRGGVP